MGLFLPQPVIQHFLPSTGAGTDPGRHTKLTNLLLNYMKSKSTSTSTLFHKTIGYNRLARKIAIANLGGPVKRKIN